MQRSPGLELPTPEICDESPRSAGLLKNSVRKPEIGMSLVRPPASGKRRRKARRHRGKARGKGSKRPTKSEDQRLTAVERRSRSSRTGRLVGLWSSSLSWAGAGNRPSPRGRRPKDGEDRGLAGISGAKRLKRCLFYQPLGMLAERQIAVNSQRKVFLPYVRYSPCSSPTPTSPDPPSIPESARSAATLV